MRRLLRNKLNLNKRVKGVNSMFLPSLMVILIAFLIMIFEIRVSSLNSMFEFIDNAVVSSALGSALINTEEYGKSNQVIIYSNEDWVEYMSLNPSTEDTMGWTQKEADIILSNLNDGSDIELEYTELEPKMVLNPTSTSSNSNTNYRTSLDDWFVNRCYNTFISNLRYNLSKGGSQGSYNYSFRNLTTDATTISKEDVLDKSFVGSYVIGDIYITRFEVYNVYRQDTARKYEYKPYTGFDTLSNTPIGTGEIPKTNNVLFDGKKFKDLSAANKQTYLDVYANDTFKVKYDRDKRAKEVKASLGTTLQCFTDTYVSWQGESTSSRPVFGYKYAFNANPLTTYASASTVSRPGEEALKTGYTVFRYVGSAGLDGNHGGNSTSEYHALTESNQTITLDSGVMAGTEITNTSIYVELTFTVGTFAADIAPDTIEEYNNHQDMHTYDGQVLPSTVTVTVGRLVDIVTN